MEDKGILALLFDLSFSEFVTTRVIKVIFILGITLAAVYTGVFICMGFAVGAGVGLLFLILSPVVFLLFVLGARIWCEMLMVIFRVAENTSRLVEQGRQ